MAKISMNWISGLVAALALKADNTDIAANTLRVDSTQSFTANQQLQGRNNLGVKTWEFISLDTLAAGTTLTKLNLGAYIALRITTQFRSGNNDDVIMQLSSDNGSTFLTTSTYQHQLLSGSGTSASASTATAAGFYTGYTGTLAQSVTELWGFNKAYGKTVESRRRIYDGTNMFSQEFAGMNTDTTARNALKLLLRVGTGTITGTVLLEGIRG